MFALLLFSLLPVWLDDDLHWVVRGQQLRMAMACSGDGKDYACYHCHFGNGNGKCGNGNYGDGSGE